MAGLCTTALQRIMWPGNHSILFHGEMSVCSAKIHFSLHSIQPHFNDRPRKLKKPLCHSFRVADSVRHKDCKAFVFFRNKVRSMLTKRTSGRLKTPGCCVRLPRMIHGLGAPLRSMEAVWIILARMDLGLTV